MTTRTVSADSATVEVTACAGSSTRHASRDGQAVPERKRSPWDHCSPSTDSGFPYFDFVENSSRKNYCAGDT